MSINQQLCDRRMRILLCLNRALFSHRMSYQETWEIRVWMQTVKEMIRHECFEHAALILGDAEFVVDAAMNKERFELAPV